jgi:hypothetical protein
MYRTPAFARIEDVGRVEIPADSGVVERRRWQAYRPEDTLGAGALIAACSLGYDREDDSAANVCFAVGGSGLRAAAWLRARGAAVGHAASRDRIQGVDGRVYELAARTRVSRHSDKMTLTLAAIGSAQIADWLRPDRVAIILVGPKWRSFYQSGAHALVVCGAAMGALAIFDPAGDGELEELPFGEADALRADPAAAHEVLLAAKAR